MAGHSTVTLQRDSEWSQFIDINVHEMYVLSVQLHKEPVLQGHPYDLNENGLERKKNFFHMMKERK